MRLSLKGGRILLLATAVTVSGALFSQLAAKEHSHDDKHGMKHYAQAAVQPLTESETRRAESLVSTICSACHGPHLEGKIGPSLQQVGQRYSIDKIERIIHSGKGKQKKVSMPAGLVSDADAVVLARWLIQRPTGDARRLE